MDRTHQEQELLVQEELQMDHHLPSEAPWQERHKDWAELVQQAALGQELRMGLLMGLQEAFPWAQQEEEHHMGLEMPGQVEADLVALQQAEEVLVVRQIRQTDLRRRQVAPVAVEPAVASSAIHTYRMGAYP